MIPAPIHVEFFRDLIEKTDGKKKAFFQAIDQHTFNKPEERELLVKAVKLLQA